MHPAANQSLLASRPSRVGRFLGFSLAGHALVLAAVGVYTTWFQAPPLKLEQTPIRATLVRLGKPRDEKLLPRKEQPPPPPPKKVEAPPSPTPPPPEPPKEAVAIPSLKPEPAPKPAPQRGETQGENRRDRLFGAFDKLAKPSKQEEDPEGAEDGDPNGDAAKAEGERYFGLISSQVRRHYNVADTIPDNERLMLKAQVAMRLGRAGEVLEARLAKASGNTLFDSAVLSAVKKASPFSPPPDPLRDMLQKSGIVLEFSP
ncbi:cell envelope integrity/translocation protein TolA [Cystobacter fuscus]|uniref:Cell envelope integrity/translocation protein TolA n=1 Tax=Cystobacter fuscus TaxID=43 RepID=A0A250JF55_9BACT|nr:energy transducer TonB [Cystobacter fuscus]ATB42535.1 cell envelope integrity/translocation protein TolA [Cystobacter fuscus]